jgi:hypothetical protein
MPSTARRLSGRLNAWDRLPVSAETKRRWSRRRSVPTVPGLALKLLEGDLGKISPMWAGWTLNPDTGVMSAPNGDTWTAGRLQAWTYERQLLDSLKRRVMDPLQPRLF